MQRACIRWAVYPEAEKVTTTGRSADYEYSLLATTTTITRGEQKPERLTSLLATCPFALHLFQTRIQSRLCILRDANDTVE